VVTGDFDSQKRSGGNEMNFDCSMLHNRCTKSVSSWRCLRNAENRLNEARETKSRLKESEAKSGLTMITNSELILISEFRM
jgi:hypothetical protein